ncbi:MAG: hypothetical protein LBC20_11745 [Planctomycetaceae bacterium]|nr:hypothetical protein [Planctomycetaceae bacterium]
MKIKSTSIREIPIDKLSQKSVPRTLVLDRWILVFVTDFLPCYDANNPDQ